MPATRILLPSIIDPRTHRGGAGTVTRSILQVLGQEPLSARIEHVLPASTEGKFHRARQFASVTGSLVSPLPSKALLTYSRRFLNEVKGLLDKQQFDLVLINGADLLWLLPHLPPGIPRILLAHNIEHQLYLSQINGLYRGSLLLRGVLMRDWRRLRDYEMSGMRRIENIIFLSNQDAEFAHGEITGTNTLLVPPIFDYQRPERVGSTDTEAGLQIGFMGNFGWWPNREGLHWFLKEVFPHTSGDTLLHLFGEQSNEAAPRHSRIVKHGFLAKTQDIWPICDFMICPIHSGGGVNVKFAEAVYNRVPVLATSFGARGLPLQSDPGIVLLNSAAEWVAFLRSPGARALRLRRLPAAIAETFAMQSHAKSVQSFVRDAMRRVGPLTA